MKKVILIIVLIGVVLGIYHIYFRDIEGNKLITEEYKNSESYINNLYYSDEYFKMNILSEEEQMMYDIIIKNTIEETREVYISCANDCSSKMQRVIDSIYLDHPEFLAFKGIGGWWILNNQIKYNNYYSFSKRKSNLASRRIERKMDDIRKDTKDMDEKDKILYVYNYVASHNYDKLFTYDKSNQSAYSFFSGGKSVCAGFAKASQMIFQNIGIKSYLVLTTNHMFNYVEYEGKYYIFDATYGTSFRNKTDYRYYDGLGNSTTGAVMGLYSEHYPKIETTKLKDIFDL